MRADLLIPRRAERSVRYRPRPTPFDVATLERVCGVDFLDSHRAAPLRKEPSRLA
jgi:hypothetical protein